MHLRDNENEDNIYIYIYINRDCNMHSFVAFYFGILYQIALNIILDITRMDASKVWYDGKK